MGGDRDDPQGRAGEHHDRVLASDAAAFRDKFRLSGMRKADLIKLRLRNRSGHERPGRAGSSKTRCKFERAQGASRAIDVGCARPNFAAILDIQYGERIPERSGRLRRLGDARDGAAPDRRYGACIAHREKRREPLRDAPVPGLGDHLRTDTGRIAHRDCERRVHRNAPDLAIFHHRIAPKVAQHLLRAQVDAILLHLVA